MCLSVFKNYASTEGQNPSYQNLYLNQNINRIFDLIINDAKIKKFDNLIIYPEYFDISYYEGDYQVSISLIEDDKTHVFMDISVLNTKKKGFAKKQLKNKLLYYFELLKDYVN